MKKVLFPFEADCHNPVAFGLAARLAGTTKNELVLLNVFSIEADNSIDKQKYGQMVKTKWVKAFATVRRMRETWQSQQSLADDRMKVRFSYRFIHGVLSKEVCTSVKGGNISVVVLSLPDESDMNSILKLSARISEDFKTATLVVPPDATGVKTREIAFVADFGRLKSDTKLFDKVCKVADQLGAGVHFLHFCSDTRDNVVKDNRTLIKALKAKGLDPGEKIDIISEENFNHQFINYLENNKIDLLFFSERQRSSFIKIAGKKPFVNSVGRNLPVWTDRE